jgi:hypothetical protein
MKRYLGLLLISLPHGDHGALLAFLSCVNPYFIVSLSPAFGRQMYLIPFVPFHIVVESIQKRGIIIGISGHLSNSCGQYFV